MTNVFLLLFILLYIYVRQDVMKKKLFYIVLGLILIATLRFYYIGFKDGFNQLPVINQNENIIQMLTQPD